MIIKYIYFNLYCVCFFPEDQAIGTLPNFAGKILYLMKETVKIN